MKKGSKESLHLPETYSKKLYQNELLLGQQVLAWTDFPTLQMLKFEKRFWYVV